MPTLPDFIPTPLTVLAIGINPSLHAVRAGYPFANPRNRFWAALGASRLNPEGDRLGPGVAAIVALGRRYGIGFTDVVKRPTPGIKDLTAADFARGVPALEAKIARLRPRVVWFHGKVAAREALGRSGLAADVPEWGLQSLRPWNTLCFVSPNPSPANARFRIADFVASYDALADVLATLEAG